MLVTPNLEDIQDEIEPGDYTVRIVDVQPETSRNGTPMLKVTFETFGESEEKNNGRRIFDRVCTAGKGAFRFTQLWSAAMGEKFDKSSPEFDTEMFHGKELTLTVIEGTDQNGNPSGFPEVKGMRQIV